MGFPQLTIGIEEEYQIINAETRELTSYVQEALDKGRRVLQDQIKPEFLQSQIEVGSSICSSMQEARAEISRLRGAVAAMAAEKGLQIAAAGTHPFSAWAAQQVTAGERYTKHERDMADVARQMLVFGMHVHVGIDDPDLRIDVMNQSRYFLPHLLALTTSSPFWHGRRTGLKSYRTIVINTLPRAGLPPRFDSWSEYEKFVATLIDTNCIDEATKIWWDLRPNPKYPTLEYRFMDICTRIDEVMCVAALIVSIVAKLLQLRRANLTWREYPRNLITESKWRAVRYGTEGKLLDLGKKIEVPTREVIHELLEFLDDVVDELGCRSDVEYVHTILDEGTSADRQLAVFEQTGDLRAVVDHVVRETLEGCDVAAV